MQALRNVSSRKATVFRCIDASQLFGDPECPGPIARAQSARRRDHLGEDGGRLGSYGSTI